MLAADENRRLTEVGPGTPMGELLRRYWHPIAAELELLEDPIKPIRILCEDLVLYRDRSGTLGLIARRCPHRSADLAYGIIDERGLRCSYHGWCFDERGACLEQPFEKTARPAGTFRERVAIAAYPVARKAGLIWAYLGPAPAPCLMDWARFHEPGEAHVSFLELSCNWLQCQENSVDPVHFEWLHQNLPEARFGTGRRAPRHRELAFDEFEHGVIYRRVLDNTDKTHPLWTVGRASLLPNGFYTGQFVWHVPVDDTTTMDVMWALDEGAPRAARRRGPPRYRRISMQPDTYGRHAVRSATHQDAVAMLGQGRIVDRTLERLGESDRGVILLRRRLMEEMQAVAAGRDPRGVTRDESRNVRVPLPLAPPTNEQWFGVRAAASSLSGIRARARGLVESALTGLQNTAAGTRHRIGRAAGRVGGLVATPGRREADLGAMLFGYRAAALLYVVAKLGVADHLAAGPLDAEALARAVGADALTLGRIMRALVAHGVFAERNRRFALNGPAERLRAGVPGSLRADALLAGEQYMPAWGGLLHSARTGQTAFDEVFGASVWEHRRGRAELNEAFNTFAARSGGAAAGPVAAAWDFGRVGHVVDVGGGVGAFLGNLLTRHAHLRGTLLELPHVAAAAPRVLAGLGVTHRCELRAGDFFVEVPVEADVYILKHVLHDWNDERARRILKACAGAMVRPDARLLVIESVLPEGSHGSPQLRMLDIHMLAVDGGRERTRAEFTALLAAAGLALVGVTTLSGEFSLLEARTADTT